MWTRTRWPRTLKVGVSALVALVLALILTPMTNPPERQTGGIVLVGDRPAMELLGPEVPADRAPVDIYTPRRTALIVEPSPTPEPIPVYCNMGGTYYHSKDCRYVTPNTPETSLAQALKVGYVRCPDCDAPEAVAG